MKKPRTAVIALILVGLLSIPARAQGIPGRWEKVEALTLEPRITVELKNGDRIEEQFEGLSPSELLLRTGLVQAAIPRADIDRITTREADRLGNGVLIGAVIGGGIGLGSVVASEGWGGYKEFSSDALFFSLLGAGVGASFGGGIDVRTKTEVVLYQAP